MKQRGQERRGQRNNRGSKLPMLLILGAAIGGGAYLFKTLKPDLVREMRMMQM